MNIVAFYFSAPGALDYPLSEAVYLESYVEIIEALRKKGVNVAVVRGDSYTGSGTFDHYFSWNGDTFVKVDEPVEVGLIYNKDDKNTIPRIDDCPIINHPDLDEICRDKILTYKTFPQFTAKTWFPTSFEECESLVLEVSTSKIVLKQNHREGGEGVHVIDKTDFDQKIYDEWSEIILQEFIDTSGGIPGIVEGLHDLRVNVLDSKIVFLYIRQPAPGSFLANYTQHAGKTKTFSIPVSKLPPQVDEMVHEIDQNFQGHTPRNYSLDFLRGPEGYVLTELNSRTTIYHPAMASNYWDFNGALVQQFVDFFNQ